MTLFKSLFIRFLDKKMKHLLQSFYEEHISPNTRLFGLFFRLLWRIF